MSARPGVDSGGRCGGAAGLGDGISIDLGEEWREPFPDRSEGARRDWRRPAVLAVNALLLFLTAAAAPAPPPRLIAVAVWTQSAEFSTLHSDALYVYDHGRLTAYDLADGSLRWRAEVAPRTPEVQFVLDDVMVFSTYPESGPRQLGEKTDTTAFDRRTGERRWHTDAEVWMEGGVLYSRRGAGADAVTQTHDPDTFAVRWTLPDAALGFQMTVDDRGLWVLSPNGLLREYDVDPDNGAMRPFSSDGGYGRSRAGLLLFRVPGAVGPSVETLLDELAGRDMTGWYVVPDVSSLVSLLARPASGADRTYLMSVAGAEPRVLGSLPYTVTRCESALATLVCSTGSGEIGIWRIND